MQPRLTRKLHGRLGRIIYAVVTPVGIHQQPVADEMCRFVTENKVLLAEVTDEEAAVSEADRESKRRLDVAFDILTFTTGSIPSR